MWSIKIANSRSIKHFFNLFLFYILGSNNNQDNAGEGQARRKNYLLSSFKLPGHNPGGPCNKESFCLVYRLSNPFDS